LPSARTFVSIHNHEHLWFSYRGLSPHKLTPVPGVHKIIEATGNRLDGFLQRLVATAPHLCRYALNDEKDILHSSIDPYSFGGLRDDSSDRYNF